MFYFRGRKFVSGQIGYYSFVGIIRNLKSDKTNIQIIIFVIMQINEIKRGGIGKTAIPCWIVRFLLLESVGLFPCQSNRFPFVKFEVWRKVERADYSSCIPNTDEVFPIFLFDVGNSIVSFIISVRNKDSLRNGQSSAPVPHSHSSFVLSG